MHSLDLESQEIADGGRDRTSLWSGTNNFGKLWHEGLCANGSVPSWGQERRISSQGHDERNPLSGTRGFLEAI